MLADRTALETLLLGCVVDTGLQFVATNVLAAVDETSTDTARRAVPLRQQSFLFVTLATAAASLLTI